MTVTPPPAPGTAAGTAAGRRATGRSGDAPEPDCPAALDGDLGWALGVAFRSYLTTTRAAMTDVPGGPRGFHLLAAAGDGAGNQLALARRLGLDRTVMTYLVDDLQDAGLVRRETDPSDRRSRRVVLTGAGEALLAELQRRVAEVETSLLAGIDPGQRATFRELLERVARHLDGQGPPSPLCGLVGDLKTTGQVPHPETVPPTP